MSDFEIVGYSNGVPVIGVPMHGIGLGVEAWLPGCRHDFLDLKSVADVIEEIRRSE